MSNSVAGSESSFVADATHPASRISAVSASVDVYKRQVYHHFKSKEDILNAAIDRESEPLMRLLVQIRDDPRMTGLEKMQALFEASMDGPQLPLSAEVAIAPDPVRNSRFLGMQYQSIINEVAPQLDVYKRQVSWLKKMLRRGSDPTMTRDTRQRTTVCSLSLIHISYCNARHERPKLGQERAQLVRIPSMETARAGQHAFRIEIALQKPCRSAFDPPCEGVQVVCRVQFTYDRGAELERHVAAHK